MKVLLVDDEIISVQAMVSAVDWESCGVDQVFSAYSVKEARRIYEREKPEILLLDIEMPEISGLEFLSWVREQEGGDRTLCAFLTCHPKFDYALEALRLDSEDYVLKPVEYAELEKLVRKLVSRSLRESEEKRINAYGRAYVSEHAEDAAGYQAAPLNAEETVAEVADYILMHLSERLRVDELAERVHLHPDYLNRLFRRYKGIPINKFIIRERMELAAKLLKENRLPATAVAQEVGYQNYSNFVGKFREYFGVNPGEYGTVNK